MGGIAVRGGLAVLTVGGLLLAGCAGDAATVSGAPGAVLTEPAARTVVQEYDAANNAVNLTADAGKLDLIEAPPLLDSSRAWLRITAGLRQEVPTIVSSNPSFHLPPSTTRPEWFLAVSTRLRGNVPGPEPTYTVYTRSATDGRWRAAYSLMPGERVPSPARTAEGNAVPADDPAGFPVPPEQLNPAIYKHYTESLSGKDAFAGSKALDEQLGNGYTEGRRFLLGQGTKLTRSWGRTLPEWYALKTADGGVLVFTANTVVDTLSSTTGGGKVQLTAGSNNAAIFGRPAGASAATFTIDRLQMFLTYLPSGQSGAAIRVLAYGEVVTAVTAGG